MATPSLGSSDVKVSVPSPGAVLAAFGSIWVQDWSDGSVWKIDRHGNVKARIKGVVPSTGTETQIETAGFGSLWTLGKGAVYRIDPATGKIKARVPVPRYSFALDAGEGAVWVACCGPATPGSGIWPRLLRIDPQTEKATVFVRTATSPSAFAVGDGYVWWGDFSEAGGVDRIDPTTGQDVRLDASNMSFIEPTPWWIWMIQSGAAQRRAATSTGGPRDPRPVKKAQQSIGATYAHGDVWLNDGGFVAFDARTGKVVLRRSLNTVGYPQIGGIAVLGHRVWIADPTAHALVGVVAR